MKTTPMLIAAVCMGLAGCAGNVRPVIQQPVLLGTPVNQDPMVWDFGTIKQDTLSKHIFEIRNNASRTLNIKDVTTSCGCTASEISQKIIGLGESARITVTFNSKGYHGETTQFVYVNTDDPAESLHKFTIKAFIE